MNKLAAADHQRPGSTRSAQPAQRKWNAKRATSSDAMRWAAGTDYGSMTLKTYPSLNPAGKVLTIAPADLARPERACALLFSVSAKS